ncbi:aspartate aminotransferase family protein [Actinosynnema mirum]|uniref:Aminotransferase class-III n=1 Tax=Actinosynnema mirum (strain ATCC 29888 / DSM 43827 / JCM 3225 / NBRC 14064 / NCIMB 13271 / NRRL B-12336 / IMRU 3971 / 101) TaxID=446462 RepID=C6WBT7_ACTMD|nr:aminotransferase class III-fold pyridoxal phosphate-dependent enzyme [Actinosynnema mirum]ACU37504.1 aminotransferase class-III [Actinosynnema mirum DSM 43827]
MDTTTQGTTHHQDTTGGDLLAAYRAHLSAGRASLGEMFGGFWETASSGATVRTSDGESFVNCAGYGVFILGGTHPHVTEAVVAQVRANPLATRLLLEPVSAAAAKALVDVCPPGLSKVHFVGSGTEATETAIKMARANGKRRLITTANGYHGKTLGSLSVTARSVYQEKFQPLLPDVTVVPYGDVDAMEAALRDGPPACVIVEPVQGEGGVVFPPDGYLAALGRLRTEHDAFLVIDEILTGLGRLGRWWGHDPEAVTPDVMLVGKGLSGGVVPVAAAVATPAAYAPFDKDPFLHTSTFSAAPVAAAAAKAAIEAIVMEDAVAKAAKLGAELKHRIAESAARTCPHLVAEVRGEGLLIGVEMRDPGLAGELVLELIDGRVLVNHSMNNSHVLRLTPPATITADELDHVATTFDRALSTLAGRFPASS